MFNVKYLLLDNIRRLQVLFLFLFIFFCLGALSSSNIRLRLEGAYCGSTSAYSLYQETHFVVFFLLIC